MPSRLASRPYTDLARTQPRGDTIAFLGDSITQGDTGLLNYGNAFPHYAIMASGGKLVATGFYGQGGETATGGLQRIYTALAKRPTYLSIAYGTNDMGQGVQASRSDNDILAAFFANITKLVGITRSNGAIPIINTIPPNNSGADSQRTRLNLKANIWLRRFALANGIRIVDYYTLLAKDGIAEGPAGNYKTIYAQDGTHPNAKGSQAMGTLLWQTISATAPLAPRVPMSLDMADTLQAIWLIPNVQWFYASVRPGVAPNNVSALGSAFTDTHTVYTIGSDATIPGTVQSISCDSSATALGGISTNQGPSVPAGALVGVSGMFSTDGNLGFQVQLVFNGTASYKVANFSAGFVVTGGVYYMEVPAPIAGAVNVQLLTTTPSGVAGVVKFGYPSVVNLAAAIGETTPINAN